MTKVIVSSKMCDKWDGLILKSLIFHFLMEIFKIVDFSFLDGDITNFHS